MIRRAYVRGHTFNWRGFLMTAGWRWDATRRAWWRDEEWRDEMHVEAALSELGVTIVWKVELVELPPGERC